jgi:hypothetical protein
MSPDGKRLDAVARWRLIVPAVEKSELIVCDDPANF